MKRILLAVLAVAWLQVAVRAEENYEPEVKLANLEMESLEIVAVAESGDLLRTNWNLKSVESSVMTWDGYTGFVRSRPATASAQLETQIATDEWARRLAVSTVQVSRCRITCDDIPSALPPFEMSWLTDDFWPLTRSYVRQDTDHDAQMASFDFFTY